MKRFGAFFLSVLLGLSLATSAEAVTCFAVDEGNMLYKFSSTAPGTATAKAIDGLPAGYRIVGLDFRTTASPGSTTPGIGTLWALGTDGTTVRAFSIDPSTAAASSIGQIAIPDAGSLSDNTWFFGFDPANGHAAHHELHL